jgi:hypothetical protein
MYKCFMGLLEKIGKVPYVKELVVVGTIGASLVSGGDRAYAEPPSYNEVFAAQAGWNLLGGLLRDGANDYNRKVAEQKARRRAALRDGVGVVYVPVPVSTTTNEYRVGNTVDAGIVNALQKVPILYSNGINEHGVEDWRYRAQGGNMIYDAMKVYFDSEDNCVNTEAEADEKRFYYSDGKKWNLVPQDTLVIGEQ